MNIPFLNYIKQYTFLTLGDIKLVWGVAKLKRVKAGEQIIRIGDLNYHGVVPLKGLLRNYYITSEGEERTMFIVSKGMATGSGECILFGKPSDLTVEAIEPSLVLLVNSKKILELAERHPRMLALQNKRFRMNIAEAAEQVRFYTVLSPEERYIEYRDKNPKLIKRVPQKHLASYLGMTPVSLSRIKKRVAEKGI